MSKVIFRDFDEFADAINGLAGCFMPTAASETDWWVHLLPIGRVAIQQVQIGGASTFAGDGTDNSITLGIPVTTPRRIRIDGNALEDNSFILIKEGQPFTFAARQCTRWAGISVPVNHPSMAPELLDALNARAFRGRSSTATQTDLPHVARGRLLVSRLCATDGSVNFLDEPAIREVEQEVVALTSRAVEASSKRINPRIGRPRCSRSRVIAKALALIEAHEGEALFVQDLCRATRVSERTLRNVFQEYFDVGPMRLLKVRQLREIRAALLAADASQKTVATIAASFGIWDFSSFTRNYKALYGETPSATLRSPPRERIRGRTMSTSWIKLASRRFMDANDVELF